MLILCNRCYYQCPDADRQLRCKGLIMRDIRALRWEQFDLMQYADDECIHISEFVNTVCCSRPILRQGRLVQGHALWDSHNE